MVEGGPLEELASVGRSCEDNSNSSCSGSSVEECGFISGI